MQRKSLALILTIFAFVHYNIPLSFQILQFAASSFLLLAFSSIQLKRTKEFLEESRSGEIRRIKKKKKKEYSVQMLPRCSRVTQAKIAFLKFVLS